MSLKPRRLKARTVTVDVFTCECGGKCAVGDAFTDYPVLVHSLPYCEEFEKMDPADYLARNSRRIAKGVN